MHGIVDIRCVHSPENNLRDTLRKGLFDLYKIFADALADL